MAETCDLVSLVVDDCRAIAGVQGKMFVIPIDGVTNTPRSKKEMGLALPAGQTYSPKAGDSVAYGEAFTYTSNKSYWRSADIVFDSGQLDFDTAGDRGFESLTSGFEAMVKGTADAQREFAENLIKCNGCGGWIVGVATRNEPNKLAILGTMMNGGNAKVKGSSGKKSGDKNVTDLKFNFDTGLTWRSYDLTALGVRLAPLP